MTNGIAPVWKLRREFWRVIGKARFALMQRRSTPVALSYCGLTIPLKRNGMSAAVVRAILSNFHGDPEIRGLRSVIRAGDRVLELGSGLGVVTALAVRAASPRGKVLSCEANPGMIADTLAFLAAHDITNVELRNAVLVSDVAEGEIREIHLASSFSVSSLLGGEGRRSREGIAVRAENLNKTVAEFAPDVLLCDIEGGELELIPALNATKLRAVVIELHPDRLSTEQLNRIRAALSDQDMLQHCPSPGGTVEVFTRRTAI